MYYQTEEDCKKCDMDTMKFLKCQCFIDKKSGVYRNDFKSPLEEYLDNYKSILLS